MFGSLRYNNILGKILESGELCGIQTPTGDVDVKGNCAEEVPCTPVGPCYFGICHMYCGGTTLGGIHFCKYPILENKYLF